MTRHHLTILVAWFLAACSAAPPSTPPAPLACTLVLLRTGPARDLPAEVRQRAFVGHFANMLRLAKDRDLLLAGPYGDPRHAEDLRGLFVLDTADRQRAEQLAGTDPTTQAGEFRLEFHDLTTDAPLRQLLADELRQREEAERQGRELQPGEGGRGYVLLTAEHGEQALRRLAGHPGVFLSARLDGQQALFVLDAEQCAAVPALLGDALAELGPHTLDAWYATAGLAHMGGRPPESADAQAAGTNSR